MGDTVLFCPFCKESFEGERQCPEHELSLVPFFELPQERKPLDPAVRLPWFSPALGRGPVAAAAAVTLLAFCALPLSRVEGPVTMGGTMLRLALESTPRLWLIPAAAIATLAILLRRRSPRGMRGVRLLMPLLALVPPAVVLWSHRSVEAAVALLSARTAQTLQPELASGAYVMLVAALPAIAFGAMLGAARSPRAGS